MQGSFWIASMRVELVMQPSITRAALCCVSILGGNSRVKKAILGKSASLLYWTVL